MNGSGHSISEVAELTGVGHHTLRYWERAGLLPEIGRAGSGHRRYSKEDVAWVEFLRCLRATGMPIARVREYVELARQNGADRSRLRQILEEHRTELSERLEELQRHLALIDRKIGLYRDQETACVATGARG